MRKFLSTSLLCLTIFIATAVAKADAVYTKTYGNPTKPSLIFIHGGPGFNSWDFEKTTAQKLADEGFFVVVYDQRGQGRSDEANLTDFNYTTYANDLKKIIDDLGLKKPMLIGHSHGGPISINFEMQYPGLAKSIILVSAPINFAGSMKSIFENCSRRYIAKNEQQSLEYLGQLYYNLFLKANLTPEELVQNVGMTFGHGMHCGLYQTSQPTENAKNLKELLKQNPLSVKLSGQTTAMPGFLQNENYIRTNYVDYVTSQPGRFFGIYGDEDGLFTPIELEVIKASLHSNVKLIQGASHAIYIDQQDAFIQAVKEFQK